MKNYLCQFILILFIIQLFTNCQTVKDIDGNKYKIVKIGNQKWLGSNLEVKHFNDNSAIPEIKDENLWANATTPAYCWYNNSPNDYGLLYNQYVPTSARNVCPEGWHIPTAAEWNILVNELGGSNFAGGKLKATGNTYWQNPNDGATDEAGFNARGGGWRLVRTFRDQKTYGVWWTSSKTGSTTYSIIDMRNNSTTAKIGASTQINGISIRCICDK